MKFKNVETGISKILQGVLKYQKSLQNELLPIFREILNNPAPKSILITCVDSRIVASRLLQTQPGANFLLRSPGNFIPKFTDLESSEPSSTPAALELACVNNKANSVVVLGHSDCKTMNLLFSMRHNLDSHMNISKNELKKWLWVNGKDTIDKYLKFEQSGFKDKLSFSDCNYNKFDAYIDPENVLDIKEKFSQINTLEQIKNLHGYSFLTENLKLKTLKAQALWLDIYTSEVYMFSYREKRFIKIDETTYGRLYAECGLEPEPFM